MGTEMSKVKYVLLVVSFFLTACGSDYKRGYVDKKEESPPVSKKDVGSSYAVSRGGKVNTIESDVDPDSVTFCHKDKADLDLKYEIAGLFSSPIKWRKDTYTRTHSKGVMESFDYAFVTNGYIEKISGEDLNDFMLAGKAKFKGELLAWKNNVDSKSKVGFNIDGTIDLLVDKKINIDIAMLGSYPKHKTVVNIHLDILFIRGGEECLKK